MAIKFSETVANAMLDTFESTISTGPTLELRTGAAPANCAAADSGTLIASMTLPSDWMAAASGGSKAKSGTWEDTSADDTGEIAHFRIKQSTTCHMQGSVSESGGGGDIIVDNTDVNAGQSISISAFTLTQSV